jgi:hypothetical protein
VVVLVVVVDSGSSVKLLIRGKEYLFNNQEKGSKVGQRIAQMYGCRRNCERGIKNNSNRETETAETE